MNPSRSWMTLTRLGLALAALMVILAPVASTQDQGKKKKNNEEAGGGGNAVATTYSGRATVLKATVLGVGTTVCDTGDLPESGGCLDASAISTSVAGLVTGDVCHATTVGQGHASRAEASVANLNLTVGTYTITAAFCMSRASATCDDSGNATATGCSEISALAVNQVGIAVTGAVNQENVSFLGLKIVINEQVKVVDGNCASITVKTSAGKEIMMNQCATPIQRHLSMRV